jgi:predicted DNA-binding protein YlxM (UPF0122 family)
LIWQASKTNQGEILMNEKAKLILLNRDMMFRLFITEDNSLKAIAAMLGVSVWSVREYMNKRMVFINPY